MKPQHYEEFGEVLDKRKAAQFLDVSSRTLDAWMRRRRIPFAKLPSGMIRFQKAQLIEFLKKYEVSA